MNNEDTVDIESEQETDTAEQSAGISENIQPSQAYADAGHPYGKNTRGKKKWLLEMKRG
jgi:hypothetical protein